MTDRRATLLMLGGLLASPRLALAQQQKKIARIGILSPLTMATFAERREAVQAGLRDLGRIDAKDIVIDYRFAAGRLESFPTLADELVRLNPDCILAGGIDAVRALMRVTKTIPIVIANIDFVVDGGLAAYAPDLNNQYRRATVFIDRILKGAKPADLPVEQPTKFVLVLNMKTAKALGITFPQAILVRAERVIE